MGREIVRMLNVDSAFRARPLETAPADADAALPDPIRGVVEMRVEDVTLPPTFRNVSAALGNSAFVLHDGVAPRTVRLPDGLYRDGAANRGGELERAVNEAMWSAGVTRNLVFTVDAASRRALFAARAAPEAAAAAAPDEFTLRFDVGADGAADGALADGGVRGRLGWLLGFRAAVVRSYADATGAAAAVGAAACHLPLLRYFYVAVEDYANEAYGGFVAPFDGSSHSKAVLARLRLDDAHCDRVKVCSSARAYAAPVTLSRLRIALTDDLGRPVDLGGCDWSALLALRCAV